MSHGDGAASHSDSQQQPSQPESVAEIPAVFFVKGDELPDLARFAPAERVAPSGGKVVRQSCPRIDVKARSKFTMHPYGKVDVLEHMKAAGEVE